jgi:hypothetical protein
MKPQPQHRNNQGTCGACGKQTFVSRKKARQAAKDSHPGEQMTAYECRERPGSGVWHFGHSHVWRHTSPLDPITPAPPSACAAMARMAGRSIPA